MYIEDRLFSENTEETLYSVLMDEDEYALYSEFQKEFGLAQKVGEAVKNKISKIGNWSKNRKIKSEVNELIRKIGRGEHLTEAELNRVRETVPEMIVRDGKKSITEAEAVKKIKPKKVKRINKEMKRKKLIDDLPDHSFNERSNLRVARGISRQNPLELSKADFAVIKNQAEKSSRFKNGLYMKDTDPAKEAFRQRHLKELRDGGAFNSQFNDKIRLKNARERFRYMDVAGTHNFDAGKNYIGESWFEKGPFIEY